MNAAIAKYYNRARTVNSFVCVGLDPDITKLPDRFKQLSYPQFEFNKWVINQTAQFTAAYKPNVASYEVRAEQGWLELRMTMEYLREQYADIFTICDAKRADIGYTNELYAEAIFDTLGFDAVTLHPYLGQEALKPFLDRTNKVCIILCRTSNPGAGELQDLEFSGKKLWALIAEKVSSKWNYNGNCMLVVGATYPQELEQVRNIVGNMTFLVPGVGTQGGSVEQVVKAGLTSSGQGLIISSSKGIIFASNPGQAAKELRDEINMYR